MDRMNELIALGRHMLDRQEKMNTKDDDVAYVANKLARVGNILVRLGQPFCTRLDEITKADAAYIMEEYNRYKHELKGY